MTLRVHTPGTEDFHKELTDMVDVFFPGRLYGEEPDLLVKHSEALAGTTRACTVTVSGAYAGQYILKEAIYQDPVVDKRVRKRQAKLALYHALKQATGKHPPWGALTGIRPTRLVYEALAEGLTLNAACARMMDLFDVRPENAGLLVDIVATQRQLPSADPKEVDVYVGIPFCPSRCRYCSFISMQVGKGTMLEPYTDALVKEIAGTVEMMHGLGLKPRAFYMGGGTPTALTAEQLKRVLAAAAPLMAGAKERTVEAGRPDSFTQEKLAVIRAAGVERISVNPQTSFDDTLHTIGRHHTKQQTERAFQLARQAGFTCINMDLIAGLPGEDTTMFESTLDWVQSLRPENLTVHTLCVKRSSDMHRLMDSLPPDDMVAYMVQLGRATADSMGMRPYYLYRQKHMAGNQANVGYALPGTECLYNVDTMEDTVSILAMGAGAISKRVTPGRHMVYRAPNVKDVGHYIARVDDMLARKQAIWDKRASGSAASPRLEDEG